MCLIQNHALGCPADIGLQQVILTPSPASVMVKTPVVLSSCPQPTKSLLFGSSLNKYPPPLPLCCPLLQVDGYKSPETGQGTWQEETGSGFGVHGCASAEPSVGQINKAPLAGDLADTRVPLA